MPKRTIALVLFVLAALAGTMTYTGYLVIGVVADHLGISRTMAGLLLGALFARFPRIRNGKLRIVGLLPQALRRPFIVGLVALCWVQFLWRGDTVPALFTGCATAFLLGYPWLRKTLFNRIVASVSQFAAGPAPRKAEDGMVIDGDFREKSD